MTKRDFFKIELEKNNLVAAPMAGISSPPFRQFLRKFFNGIVYTELTSVEGVSRANTASLEYLDTLDKGPVVAQFFGGNSDSYKKAIEEAEKYCPPSAYDVNMGCPVKKVIKTGGGCALLRDTNKVAEIVKAVRGGTDKAFSIKIRTGWEENDLVYMDILDIAQDEGADALILHARTRTQMFGGEINYNALEELVNIANIPIIGNGGVVDHDSYIKMKNTGVKGIMIGRAMMSTPWIFETLKKQKDPEDYYTPIELYKLLLELYSYMLKYSGDNDNRKDII